MLQHALVVNLGLFWFRVHVKISVKVNLFIKLIVIKDGYFKNQTGTGFMECLQCHISCSTCESYFGCESCPGNYYLFEKTKSCNNTCPIGFFAG